MKIIAIEEAFSMDGLRGLPSVADLARSAISIDPQVVEDWKARLPDVTTLRLADMDAHGVDVQVLSLTVPGIQGIADTEAAVEDARVANDYLATVVAAHPDRFRGFAALPLQDPAAAAAELHRCVRELGFCGAYGVTLATETTSQIRFPGVVFLPVLDEPGPVVFSASAEEQRRLQEIEAARTGRLFASTETRNAAPAATTANATPPMPDLTSLGLAPQPTTPTAQDRQTAFLNQAADRRRPSIVAELIAISNRGIAKRCLHTTRNPPMLGELRGVRAKGRVSLRLVFSQEAIPMSRRGADHPQSRLFVVSGILPDDLYDYVPQDEIETPTPRIGRPPKHDVEMWNVTDDWPDRVPVTEAEIDLFEAWFGDIFDELFGPSR